jgi:serine protease
VERSIRGVKKSLSAAIILAVTFSLTGNSYTSSPFVSLPVEAMESSIKYEPNQLVIGFHEYVNLEESSRKIRAKFGLTQFRIGYKGNFEVVKTPDFRNLDELKKEIAKEKDVRYVEFNYVDTLEPLPRDILPLQERLGGVYPLLSTASWLSDPLSTFQWNLDNHGRQYSNGSISHYGIQVQKAWEISTGYGVKIAILDTGVAYENYGKYKQAPDLKNTRFDVENARDFTDNYGLMHANDDHGNGTFICGIIAASTNDAYGCAGIAYDATILPIKVLDRTGSGNLAARANGIYWAVDQGARVINLCNYSSEPSQVLLDAIKYAYDKGSVLVSVAGNHGTDKKVYPAFYDQCLSVGATRYDGAGTFYSNFGSWLDVVAPGGDAGVDQNNDMFVDCILQQSFLPMNETQLTANAFGFYWRYGTQYAAAHVSAIAALVLSIHPHYTNEQIRKAIITTAKCLGSEYKYGAGLVDAYAAVSWKSPTP